jgi:glutathione S-transferase
MDLMYNKLSPFARKCRILAYELNLDDQLTLTDLGVISPLQPNKIVLESNPLGQIPSLVLADGTSLQDSRVICEYLNSIGDGPFFPNNPDARFYSLQLQALADGLMDAAVATRYELAFLDSEQQWHARVQQLQQRMVRVIQHFDKLTSDFKHKPTIGEITVACALGYIDLRFKEINWRAENINLAQWYEQFEKRESMRMTRPTI